MTMTAAAVLTPLPITAAMLLEGTNIAEPDESLGEALWVSASSYEVDDEAVDGHVVYACVQDHTGRTARPASDPEYWLEKQPSNRFAAFDQYISTATQGTGSIVFVLQPGFFADVALYGAKGERARLEVFESVDAMDAEEEPIALLDEELWEQALGLWELLFAPLGSRSTVQLDDVPLHPTAVLRVTISSADDAPVALGSLVVGEWRSLVGSSPKGGAEWGAECEPKSHSYIKGNDDGTFKIIRRHSATDLRFNVVMDAGQAEYVAATLRQILDVPVAVRAANVPGYGYLNTVGLVSGVVRAKNVLDASANFRVKGII